MGQAFVSPEEFCDVVQWLQSCDVSTLTAESVRTALDHLAAMSAWTESHKISLVRRLQQLSQQSSAVSPTDILAATHGGTRTDAKRTVARVSTLDLVPQLNEALHAGAVSVAHIDAVTSAFSQLEDHERARVAERGDWINMVATHSTPDNFARAVRHAVRQLHNDEGLSVLERQRKRTFLRHWVDRDSGMVCMRGEFDPESGLRIIGRLQNTLEKLFRGYTVNGEVRTPDHLRALSMCALMEDATPTVTSIHSGSSRAEVSVIVDLQTLQQGLHQHSILHTGADVELPVETVRRMACDAKIVPIVFNSNGVVLDLGRATRLASRNQRRALEAMYSSCAMPNCHVPVGQCQPHHIDYWNMGGPTDLKNLLPLCAHHHRCVHEGGWKLEIIGASRGLRVREPGRTAVTVSLPDSVRRRQ